MTCLSISNCAISIDQTLDYVPFVSTLTNGAILVAKVALSIFESYCPSCFQEMADNQFVNYVVNQKHVCICILLAVPFLNIFFAYALDIARTSQHNAPRHPNEAPPMQISEQIMNEVERSSQETLVRSQEIAKQSAERIENIRSETVQLLNSQIQECDTEINQCSGDEEGQRKSARLKIRRDLLTKQLDSYQKTGKS